MTSANRTKTSKFTSSSTTTTPSKNKRLNGEDDEEPKPEQDYILLTPSKRIKRERIKTEEEKTEYERRIRRPIIKVEKVDRNGVVHLDNEDE